jgi:hypothetical protein
LTDLAEFGGIVVRAMAGTPIGVWTSAWCLFLVLGGCAGGTSGDQPRGQALPAGETCQSVRAELDNLDAKGTRSKVEAASRGQKLATQARVDVDRYNDLLNAYLGARCHV